jgi:hypothetical protein
VLSQIKTFALVTAIALVVWLFAESESVRTRELTLVIELPSDPSSSLIIQPFEPSVWRERVQVTINGSAAALAAFQAGASKPLKLTPDMDGMPSSPGEGDLDFRRVLRPLPLFAARGVTITRAEPASLRVWVDRIVKREGVRVEAAGLTVDLEGPAVVTPRTVNILGPESVLARLPQDAAALARPSQEDLSRLVPGRPDKLQGVTIEVPPEIAGMERFVRLDPPRADIELTVVSKRSSATVGSVPVQVLLPMLIAQQWEVTSEQTFFSDVQASGPSELIDQLRRNELRVFAIVSLSADELERGIAAKEAVFTTLPSSALTFKSDNPIVKLKVTRRPAPKAPNEAPAPEPIRDKPREPAEPPPAR